MTAWDFDRAASVRQQVSALGASASAVQAAAQRAGVEVPDAVRATYERAEQEEQYAALATALPKAATAVTAVGAAQRAAAEDRDPLSGLGASVLGVQDRAGEAVALLEDGQYVEATAAADDATSRSEKALLVGLALPVLVLLLVLGVVWWVRRFLAASARRRAAEQAEREAALAALATLAPAAPEGSPAPEEGNPASGGGHPASGGVTTG